MHSLLANQNDIFFSPKICTFLLKLNQEAKFVSSKKKKKEAKFVCTTEEKKNGRKS
jgi:hypothetical protein